MGTPSEVTLKPSGIDPSKTGIWADEKIDQGAKFGPFEGIRVQEISEHMDSAFVWEIVDKETKEFLCYIDATGPNVGNWMKYIGCARYFEEQNIVSEQEGTDIYYKAIKNIDPGEELLTWYEKIPIRKQRGRKKKQSDQVSSRSSTPSVDIYSKKYKVNPKRKATEEIDSEDELLKRPKRKQKKITKYSEYTDSEYISDGYISGSSEEVRAKNESPVSLASTNDKTVSKQGSKTVSTSKSDVEDEDKDEDKIGAEEDEDEVFEDDDIDSMSVCSASLKLDQEASVPGSGSRSVSTSEPDKFQFDLKVHHVVKSRLGRKVFKCDICMAVYRHAFSLKRHYIRNHINYKYVTKGDLQNCQITTEALETLVMATALQQKQREQVELAKRAGITKEANASNCTSIAVDTCLVNQDDSQCKSKGLSGEGKEIAATEKNCDTLLSPGKDENRNKITDDPEGASNDKEEHKQNTGVLVPQNAHNGNTSSNDVTAKQPKDNLDRCETNSANDVCAEVPSENRSENKDDKENSVELTAPPVTDSKTVVATEESDKNIGKTASAETTEKQQFVNSANLEQNKSTKEPSTECMDTRASDELNDHQLSNKASEDTSTTTDKAGDKSNQFLALYRCNVCNFCFDTTQQLRSHIEDHPDMPNMKAFGCDKCDMRFSHKQNLIRHQAVHTGAKPFTCRYCGKNFPTVTNQKRHERIHLGRRVQCEYCTSSFTQSGDLKKHTRKLHPEYFHECAFCAKYYPSQKELISHLDSHNENFASNKDEEDRRRQAFRVDMEKDREESMRLAESKPGYKFACTVCKKRFHDYANMCRHRRLAHQRHLLISKKVRMCNNIDRNIDGDKIINDAPISDLEPNSYFYNNVARNISENLKYFVEGGMDDLQNYASYIRWKSEDHQESSTVNLSKKQKTQQVLSSPVKSTKHDNGSKDEVLTKYNFPTGFQLTENFTEIMENRAKKDKDNVSNEECTVLEEETSPEPVQPSVTKPLVLPPAPKYTCAPNGIFRPFAECEGPAHSAHETPAAHTGPDPGQRTFDAFQIVSGTISHQIMGGEVSQVPGLPPPQLEPYNFSTKPDKSSQSQAEATCEIESSPLPIKTPSVKICAVCRSIFSNEKTYVKHMMDKHKITVELSPTSARENVPILPSQSVPPVDTEVTVISSNVSPQRPGMNQANRSPRTCLNVPQIAAKPQGLVYKPTAASAAAKYYDKPRSHTNNIVDLSAGPQPSTSKSPRPACVLDLTTSTSSPGSANSIDLTCKEYVLDSPKLKSGKNGASGKNKSKSPANRFVLQTPKIVPRFDKHHKNKEQNSSNSKVLHKPLPLNGSKVSCFSTSALDLTKDADPTGLNSYHKVDACLQYGAIDYSSKQLPADDSVSGSGGDKACDEVKEPAETPASNRDSLPPPPPPPPPPPVETPSAWSYQPYLNPNPVGLLNVCSSQVPNQDDKVRYSCTKCSKRFSVIANLHAHILDCAAEGKKNKSCKERIQQKYVFKKGLGRVIIQSKKIPSASQQKLKAAIGFQKKMFLGKMKGSAFFTSKDEEYYNGDSAACKRRRSFELMYNPQNHMRRRELTEVLDMHRCHGCGLRFGTISLLERHIRVCKHKEKIKEMHAAKTTVTGRRIHKRPKDSFLQDAHKQKCRYCDKLFTYIGMLKKHILDICPVRKEYFEHGNEDHIDKEWEVTIMCIGGVTTNSSTSSSSTNPKESVTPDNMSDVSDGSKVGRKKKGRGRRKNRKWGNINKRKKSPDNLKTDDNSVESLAFSKSLDEQEISDSEMRDNGNYSDDTETSIKDEVESKNAAHESNMEADNLSEVDSMCNNSVSETNTEETSLERDSKDAIVDENEAVTEEIGLQEKISENKSPLQLDKYECSDDDDDDDNDEVDNITNSKESKDIKENLVKDEDECAKQTMDSAKVNVSETPTESEAVQDKNTNPVFDTKRLLDLSSTIAKLKERTNITDTDKLELEEGQEQSESRENSPKKSKTKKKKQKSEETVQKTTTVLKQKKSKNIKQKDSTETPEASKNPDKVKNSKLMSPKKPTKKVLKKNASLAPTEETKEGTKPVVKRGRKPKLSAKSNTIQVNSEVLDKSSSTSALQDKQDAIIDSVAQCNTSTISPNEPKKCPKTKRKNLKNRETKETNSKGTLDSSSESLTSKEIEASNPEINNGSAKKKEKIEIKPGNKELPENVDSNENKKPKKLGRKKKLLNDKVADTSMSEGDKCKKEIQMTTEPLCNGIPDEKAEVSPVKGKRGPKKKISVDSVDMNKTGTETKKVSKLNQSPTIVKETNDSENKDSPKEPPKKRGRKPSAKALNSELNSKHFIAQDSKQINGMVNGGGRIPRKRKSPAEKKDSPQTTPTRAASRSTSRSTSRSRSRSIQRDFTPPPAKKAKTVANKTKNTKDSAAKSAAAQTTAKVTPKKKSVNSSAKKTAEKAVPAKNRKSNVDVANSIKVTTVTGRKRTK